MLNCPLCSQAGIAATVEDRYGVCPRCGLWFMDARFHLAPGEEKARYELHTDDVHDAGYQNYLRPLYEAITERFPKPARGLDFGCGRAPVLGKMLEGKGHQLSYYDPFFVPDTAALVPGYDFVITTEVVEHFFHPAEEFARLRQLVRPGGALGIMTQLTDGIDFPGWFYRRDPSHVVFYSRPTFEWIAAEHGWRANFEGRHTVVLD